MRVLDMPELADAFDERIAEGFLYGDFQFATAPDSPEFLRTGVLSSYRRADPGRDRAGRVRADLRRDHDRYGSTPGHLRR